MIVIPKALPPLLLAAMLLAGCGASVDPTPTGPSDGRPAALRHLRRHALGNDAVALTRPAASALPAVTARELGLRRLVLRASEQEPTGATGFTLDPRLRELLAERRPPTWLWLATVGEMSNDGEERLEGWLDARATRVADERFGAGEGAVRLRAWQRPADLGAEEYPPTVAPVELGPLELLGWAVSPEPLEAGRAARLSVAWLVNQAEPSPPLSFALELVDGRGRDFALPGVSAAPFGGLRPPPTWPVMDITVAPHALALPEDLPPGRYRLTLRVREEGREDAVWPETEALELGAVRVTAKESAPGGAR